MKIFNQKTRNVLVMTALSFPCLSSCHLPVATAVHKKAENSELTVSKFQIELREGELEEVLEKLRKCQTHFDYLDEAGQFTDFSRETKKYNISNRFANLIYEIKLERTIPSEDIHSLINDVLTIVEDQEKLTTLIVGYSKNDIEKIPIFTAKNKESALKHYNKIKEKVVYTSDEITEHLVHIDQIID